MSFISLRPPSWKECDQAFQLCYQAMSVFKMAEEESLKVDDEKAPKVEKNEGAFRGYALYTYNANR